MITTQCNICKHNQGLLTCTAFPKKIPFDILEGDFDHTEKHPEQKNNITFEEEEIE